MSSWDPFEYGRLLAESWAAAGKVLLTAQQAAGRAYAQSIAESMQVAAAATGLFTAPDLSGDLAELTRAHQALLELGAEALILPVVLAAQRPGLGEASPTVEATFRNMLDPSLWRAGGGEIDAALNRMAEGPRLADLWEAERRWARVLRAWLEVHRCTLAHNAVVLEGWLRAGRRFLDVLAQSPATGRAAPDGKALLALWTETANHVLLETQRSERFLTTQTASIRASTALRAAQRDLVEAYGEPFGFPTRTELDDVHRSVTELRRELRALTRHGWAPAGPAGTAVPAAAARPQAAGG